MDGPLGNDIEIPADRHLPVMRDDRASSARHYIILLLGRRSSATQARGRRNSRLYELSHATARRHVWRFTLVRYGLAGNVADHFPGGSIAGGHRNFLASWMDLVSASSRGWRPARGGRGTGGCGQRGWWCG